MKSLFKTLALVCAASFIFAACEKSTLADTTKVESEVPASVIQGDAASFIDYTLNVSSRAWTFQDGTPATSSDAEVSVIFGTVGEKAVTLNTTFTDGSVKTTEYVVNVMAPIEGELSVSALTKMGCVKIGKETTFSINGLSGDYTYAWTFEGGAPATSTDAAPKVTFAEQNRYGAAVSCVVTRKADNASKTFEGKYIVGNYTLNLPNDICNQLDFDVAGFEATYTSPIVYYKEGADFSNHVDGCSIVEGGAEGTAHAFKIPFKGKTIESSIQFVTKGCFIQNPSFTKGDKIRVTFCWKAVYNEGAPVGYVNLSPEIQSLMKSSSSDLSFKVGEKTYCSKNDWSLFFPGKEIVKSEYFLAGMLWQDFGAASTDPQTVNEYTATVTNLPLGTTADQVSKGTFTPNQDWIKWSYEFVCEDTNVENAYILVWINWEGNDWNEVAPANLNYILIDEVYFELVEE